MQSLSLKSKYHVKVYKPSSTGVNNARTENILQQSFEVGKKETTIVFDLSYIRAKNSWHYWCVMIQLSTRDIVSYQIGKYKTADFVMSTLSKLKIPLSQIDLFHLDRGKEFDNQSLKSCFHRFAIKCSLSKKGCPHDNAVVESRFKSIKAEFIQGR